MVVLLFQYAHAWTAQGRWTISLAQLAWTKTTPKCKLKYFENGITSMDSVQTIWLLNVILTIFIYFQTGTMKCQSLDRQKNL